MKPTSYKSFRESVIANAEFKIDPKSDIYAWRKNLPLVSIGKDDSNMTKPDEPCASEPEPSNSEEPHVYESMERCATLQTPAQDRPKTPVAEETKASPLIEEEVQTSTE